MRSEESVRRKYGYAVRMLKAAQKERPVRSRVLAYWQAMVDALEWVLDI